MDSGSDFSQGYQLSELNRGDDIKRSNIDLMCLCMLSIADYFVFKQNDSGK